MENHQSSIEYNNKYISNIFGALSFGIYNQYLTMQENNKEYNNHSKLFDKMLIKNNEILYKKIQLIK